MKVLLINGSPRKDGCTNFALQQIIDVLSEHKIESELLQIGTQAIRGCTACQHCKKPGNDCIFDDMANEVIRKMRTSDALIVGSPVYFAAPNASLMALLDRAFYSANEEFILKPAAAVVSSRRAGTTAALDALWKYFTLAQMPLVSSCYWPMIHGSNAQEAAQDLEGVHVMRRLGRNMAWLLQCIKAGDAIPNVRPEAAARVHTNFIR
ncbi:MAG: flavodoxin family protein [Bradymonadales bacterium]